MELKVIQGSIQESTVDTLIVNLFEGMSEPGGAAGAVDKALGGALREMIANGDLTGKADEVGVAYPRQYLPACPGSRPGSGWHAEPGRCAQSGGGRNKAPAISMPKMWRLWCTAVAQVVWISRPPPRRPSRAAYWGFTSMMPLTRASRLRTGLIR